MLSIIKYSTTAVYIQNSTASDNECNSKLL